MAHPRPTLVDLGPRYPFLQVLLLPAAWQLQQRGHDVWAGAYLRDRAGQSARPDAGARAGRRCRPPAVLPSLAQARPAAKPTAHTAPAAKPAAHASTFAHPPPSAQHLQGPLQKLCDFARVLLETLPV